ncbi:granulocyte-macrophage colony-stimulating factor isoform X1 [Loxodonta africana]|uniref:granulocyte-macrophage colony-stimulating factor isoform X1 n=1 Tax=Loxodonta africana TaxID=9785 RepID=UPI0030D2B1C2
MHLCVLLAWTLWVSGSHSAPMKITTASLLENHTAICAEIQKELSADNSTYNGSFDRPQNTSEELCYGKFTKNFISTLKNVSELNKEDCHINKVYKDMKELTTICTKLKPTELPKNCTIERSSFSQFKKALQSVVISIEGWKSCNTIKGSL